VQALSERDARLRDWLRTELALDLSAAPQRLSGGNSNVTELLDCGETRLVLRRPPDNAISASAASGIRREYAMLTALYGHAPVPRPLGFCDDTGVIGQAFALVAHVDGVSITTALPPAYPGGPDTVRCIGEALIDGLAAIHALDWQQAGVRLPKTPPDQYLTSQITRWTEVRAQASVRALPLVQALADWLLRHLPAHRQVAILHGDFHLDNTLFRRASPELAAVIDWELATVGDPMADLGLCLAFWGERSVNPPGFSFVQAVTRDCPSVSREALAARWSAATGFDSDALDYYRVFALWRLAAIVEGAYVLQVQGKVDSAYARSLEYDVPAMLSEAALIAQIDSPPTA
jgi:aminoglycoside phosphotransferase (APT) family kinase protein